MKKTTLFTSLIMVMFLLGTMIANAQLSEIWKTTPDWINNGVLQYDYRGIAYNPSNNHLYVGGSTGADAGAGTAANNKIKILDGNTGAELKTLTLEPLTLAGMGYGIADVEVSSDGGIFAIQTTLNYFHPLKMFYWANENSQPVKLWEVNAYTHSNDFSGGFSVTGDYTKEALIVIPIHNMDSVYYFEVANGVMSSLKKLKLNVVKGVTYAHAYPISTKISDGFWYNNSVLQKPTFIDGNGNAVGSISNTLFTGTTGGAKQFTVDGKKLLVVSNAGNIKVIDITNAAADFSDVDATDVIETISGNAPAASSTYGYGQEEAVQVNPDKSYGIYSLSGYRYIKLLANEAAPVARDLFMTGFAMVDSLAQVSYTYTDINGDEEGISLFSWFTADDNMGANKMQVGTGSSYTVKVSDMDKYLSFDVLPVAKTGTLSDMANTVSSPYYGPVTTGASKPVASNLTITGDAAVYSVLTGAYTFTDADGDEEGNTIVKWWRADDAAGTNAVQVAMDTNMYKVLPADNGKYIVYSVIPVSQSPNLSEGDSVAAVSAEAVIFPAFAPLANNVLITGKLEVSRILTGSYSFSDLNSDTEGATELKWYRAADITAEKTVVATDTNRYELVAGDEGKVIFFGVKPVTVDGEMGTEVFDTTGVIAPKPAEAPPVASNVIVKGNAETGVLLSGTYTYTDYSDDAEGQSIIKWYMADDATAANKTEITAAAGKKTYLVPEAYVGKYFVFEVTPVALTGGLLVGTPVSDTTTAAAVASTNNGDFERMFMGALKSNSVPYYMASAGSTERNLAVGSEHVYIASRNGGTRLYKVNKTDGSYVGEMKTTNMNIGLFKISDVEVSTDGQILACPLQINALTEPFVIYKWENELAEPVKWIEFTAPEAMRLGDKFTVVGNVSDDAIIYAAASANNKVIRWVITDGVVGEPTIIVLEGTTSIGSTAAAYPFDATAESNFIVSGRGFQTQIFDKNGKKAGYLDGIGSLNTQANSPNIFYHKGRTMAAFHQKNEFGMWNILVKDITTAPHITVGVSEVLSDANQELGGVHVISDNDYFHMYMLSANNGIAYFRGMLELPEYVSSVTNWEGDKLFVDFSKNLTPETVSPTTINWTVKANDIAVEIDSLFSIDNQVTIQLKSNMVKGDAITLAYNGLGNITAFDGMPLSAFGPVNVVSVIGVVVPEASMVSISGTLQVGQTVSGTYTYTDADGDTEGVSLYQWYYATNVDGTDKLKIIGEKALNYTISSEVIDKYIAFEVTPVAATGGEEYRVGEPVMSAFMMVSGVGVSNDLASQVSMYPNPVNDLLTITGAQNVTEIQVFDYTGRTVMILSNDNQTELFVSVASLNSGVYMVQIVDIDGRKAVKRIVKN